MSLMLQGLWWLPSIGNADRLQPVKGGLAVLVMLTKALYAMFQPPYHLPYFAGALVAAQHW